MKDPIKYQRVLPRDLFNEAKLLKCFGHLCLLILDNKIPPHSNMLFYSNGKAFDIELYNDGSLSICNIEIWIKDKMYSFFTTYNSKANYPLYLEHLGIQYDVFMEDGTWTDEFIDFCKNIAK